MKGYFFSADKKLLDADKICSLLKDCFWSKNIPLAYVKKFIEHSLCFGVYQKGSNKLVGFGRVITDYTTYGYICDVIIDPLHRGKGLGKSLVDEIMNHPQLQGFKTLSLRTTEESRKIYESKGFKVVANPQTLMEIDDLEIYSRPGFCPNEDNLTEIELSTYRKKVLA